MGIVLLMIPYLALIALMIVALVALAALAWATVSVLHTLGRAISRLGAGAASPAAAVVPTAAQPTFRKGYVS
jgi:hypothetical protein